jgi:hypothetical protein
MQFLMKAAKNSQHQMTKFKDKMVFIAEGAFGIGKTNGL